MNAEALLEMARRGELYPGVILHGAGDEERRTLALELARTLLCQEDPAARPCGACRHCKRIFWPGDGGEAFHPDFRVLLKDLKTSTSVGATREFLRGAQVSPFEARGQVFVVANAESLTAEAANSLLKVVEEPPDSAPRHFLLLAPSQLDLLPTVRSRSLAVYLGAAEAIDGEQVADLVRGFGAAVRAYAENGAAVYLLSAAGALAQAGGFEDPRASRPWSLAAAAVTASVDGETMPLELRRRLLALAAALLEAPKMRLRAIGPERILEGLISRHLAGPHRQAV